MTERMTTHHQPIRFGWASGGHAVIRLGAFQHAALSPDLKQVLWQNAVAIRQADDAQDQFHAGSGHFLNLDASDNGNNNPVPKSTWQRVCAWFTPGRKSQIQQAWQQRPLDPRPFLHGQNILTSTVEAYKEVVIAFQYRNALPEALRSHPQVQAMVSQAIGKLAHYVGDLFMPLHLTQAHTWETPGQTTQDMHAFIEQELLGPQDYAAIQALGARQPQHLLPLNSGNLVDFLGTQVQQNYLKVFDLVDWYRQKLLAAIWPDWQQRMELKNQELKTLLAEQFLKSQTTLASLLQGAWQESGGAR